jgi:hypothetical protein
MQLLASNKQKENAMSLSNIELEVMNVQSIKVKPRALPSGTVYMTLVITDMFGTDVSVTMFAPKDGSLELPACKISMEDAKP